ncbi:HIT family protein [Nonomuraea endophytica]|uniref:HIT family protein n=1 Tax=Nonomuraea endophytica TaxID=714136 RepID=UPI0037CA9290
MSGNHTCQYCRLNAAAEEPPGGWIHRDAFWSVYHGPADASIPGTMKIVSRRHFVDFAEMTASEAAAFGPLLAQLDTALRATTDAERVHLVSTRDRVQHFHAWLYPRPASHPLRGTDFLAAPQHGDPAEAVAAAHAVRRHLIAAAR